MAGQLFSVNSLGGFLNNDDLSRQMRVRSQTTQRFRQFTELEPAAGANKGESVFYNKISNISTSGGTLIETNTIPKNNYTITQGTLTMTEYGKLIAAFLSSLVYRLRAVIVRFNVAGVA